MYVYSKLEISEALGSKISITFHQDLMESEIGIFQAARQDHLEKVNK